MMNPRKNPTLTEEFLKECENVGVTIVAIYTTTKLIPDSLNWPFSPTNSVFGNNRYNDWPAIWKATDNFEKKFKEIKSSCGNPCQRQIAPNILKKGVYILKDSRWIKE